MLNIICISQRHGVCLSPQFFSVSSSSNIHILLLCKLVIFLQPYIICVHYKLWWIISGIFVWMLIFCLPCCSIMQNPSKKVLCFEFNNVVILNDSFCVISPGLYYINHPSVLKLCTSFKYDSSDLHFSVVSSSNMSFSFNWSCCE